MKNPVTTNQFSHICKRKRETGVRQLGLCFQCVETREVKPYKQDNVLCVLAVALNLLLNVNINLISH